MNPCPGVADAGRSSLRLFVHTAQHSRVFVSELHSKSFWDTLSNISKDQGFSKATLLYAGTN